MADVPERLSVVRANIDDPTDLMRHLERALSGTGPAVAPVSPAGTVAATDQADGRASGDPTEGARAGGTGTDGAGAGSGEPMLTPALARALAPERPLESSDVAVVLPTSGSTGEPKGVLLSASALTASANATLARLGGPGRWLLTLSPARIAGLQVLIRSVVAGVGPPVTLAAAASGMAGSGPARAAAVPDTSGPAAGPGTAGPGTAGRTAGPGTAGPGSAGRTADPGSAAGPGTAAVAGTAGSGTAVASAGTDTGGGPDPGSGTGTVDGPATTGFDPDAFAAATRVLMTPVSTGPAGDESAGRYYTSLVPTQLLRLLDAGGPAADALRAYDAVLVGGAAASESLLRRARAAGVAVVTTYGATETCGGCVYDGAPLDGVSVSLEADGRILIGGDVLFSGYRLDSAGSAAVRVGGWFRTADLGRIDEQGRLAVLGRTDDVVVSGGVNVPLPAVQDAVSAMPSVTACAVLGVPDPVWGSKVVAFVVPRSDSDAPALAEVRDAVSALHPREYAPRKVVVLPELPMLESGKVDRLRLRSALS